MDPTSCCLQLCIHSFNRHSVFTQELLILVSTTLMVLVSHDAFFNISCLEAKIVETLLQSCIMDFLGTHFWLGVYMEQIAPWTITNWTDWRTNWDWSTSFPSDLIFSQFMLSWSTNSFYSLIITYESLSTRITSVFAYYWPFFVIKNYWRWFVVKVMVWEHLHA